MPLFKSKTLARDKLKKSVIQFPTLINNPIKLGLVAISVSLIVLGISIFRKNVSEKKIVVKEVTEKNANISLEDLKTDTGWQNFVNEEYGFSIQIPVLLLKREVFNGGRYLYFVRFEENQFSKGKGVALGVNNLPIEEEERKIIEDMRNMEFSVEARREDIKIGGFKAIKLTYGASENTEARTFLIINNGNYTLSISSVPEQMERIIEKIRFLSVP